MFGQIIVTGIFAYYLINYTQTGTSMLIPFTHGKYLNLGVFFIPAVFIILLGTVNGANFTDGLDGLASSVTVLIATFFTVAAIGMGHNDLAAGIWPVSCATVRDGQFTTGSPDVDRHCGSDKRILCRYPEKYADSGKYFSRSLLLSARNVYRSTLYVLLQLAVQHHTCTRR